MAQARRAGIERLRDALGRLYSAMQRRPPRACAASSQAWLKLAALAAMIGLAGGVTEARAESWTGPDKRRHLAAGALVAAPVSMLTDSWRAGAAAGCAVGVLKEINDMRSPGHTPSYKDAVVTCVGAAVGAQIGVMVAPVKGGVFVGKSWSF